MLDCHGTVLSATDIRSWHSGGGGEGEGGGGEGEGGEGEGGGGEGGGGEGEGGGGLGDGGGGLGEGGDGDGGIGDGEGEDGQQASLQLAESFLYFFRHIFLQSLGLRHFFVTLFLSILVHVFLLLSSVQSFGVGAAAVPRARPPLISGFVFLAVSKATSGVVDGATAPTQLSTR